MSQEDPLLRREVWATVLFAFAAIEAFFNSAAYYYARENPSKADLVSEDGRAMFGLRREVHGWTKIITGKEFDKSGRVWFEFVEAKKLRNAIVHFNPEKINDAYNKATVQAATVAVRAARGVMLQYHACADTHPPPWLKQTI